MVKAIFVGHTGLKVVVIFYTTTLPTRQCKIEPWEDIQRRTRKGYSNEQNK
jgi:hypothetical protein